MSTLTLDHAELELKHEVLAPTKPTSIEDTGIGPDTITSLIVKWLNAGEASGMDLADRIRLPYGILEPLIEHLRVEHLVEVKRAVGTGTAGYRYCLTGSGRERALRYFTACAYVGAAPVPLDQYTSYLDILRKQPWAVGREEIAAGFSHLIMEPDMFDQLGPAVASRRSIF